MSPNTGEIVRGQTLQFSVSGSVTPPVTPAAAGPGTPVRLGVFGLDGRLVRTLVDGPLGAGRHEALWDGVDDRGQPVAPGIYFVHLEAMGHHLERKVVRIE